MVSETSLTTMLDYTSILVLQIIKGYEQYLSGVASVLSTYAVWYRRTRLVRL
jgi:hypothetical protein